jgi:D-alanyl-D-alanine carboxypeptidase
LDHQGVPADLQAIFDKPFYNGAVWGLHVVDLDSGKTLIDLQPDCLLFIGSVRKVFSVGELVNQIGPDHRYNTPVYRRGEVSADGVLHGDLVLVAWGDLTVIGVSCSVSCGKLTTSPPRGQVPANHYATAAVCARAHGKLSTKLTIILNPPKLTASTWKG